MSTFTRILISLAFFVLESRAFFEREPGLFHADDIPSHFTHMTLLVLSDHVSFVVRKRAHVQLQMRLVSVLSASVRLRRHVHVAQ